MKVVLTGEGADELFAGYEYVHSDEFSTPDTLQAELVRSIESLHELNLQRCDRATMNYGLEARVPFLDATVMREMLALPAEWKLKIHERTEKQLLREAFDGMVPSTSSGAARSSSGTAPAPVTCSRSSWRRRRPRRTRRTRQPPTVEHGWELRSDEEIAYYRTWHRSFSGVRPNATLGAFATA